MQINLANHLYRDTVWTVRVSGLPDGGVVPTQCITGPSLVAAVHCPHPGPGPGRQQWVGGHCRNFLQSLVNVSRSL